MYCLKDGRMIGVTLLSEIPVPLFGTLCPQQPFLQFVLEFMHGEAIYDNVYVEMLDFGHVYFQPLLGAFLFAPTFSNILWRNLFAFHSFLARY